MVANVYIPNNNNDKYPLKNGFSTISLIFDHSRKITYEEIR